VIIWETDGLHPIKKQYEAVISGAIKDISWTFDNQRILVCGEGKASFAKIFILDTGSSAGEIINNSKQLNGGDIKPTRLQPIFFLFNFHV
jgi:WD repeat-containing protein 1 (actin-interacting protein 1)